MTLVDISWDFQQLGRNLIGWIWRIGKLMDHLKYPTIHCEESSHRDVKSENTPSEIQPLLPHSIVTL